MKYLIKGGTVVDPSGGIEEQFDILIFESKIEEVARNIIAKDAKIVDAGGMIVTPGFVDMHVHFREPGREDEETVLTGTRAAAKGGFSSVACMPNTDPALDNADTLVALKDIISRDALINVLPIGAITIGRFGKDLTDIKAMARQGIVAVSDDGSSVEDPELMLKALKSSKAADVVVIDHCEDVALSNKGVMNKGFMSTKMGLRGISDESEWRCIERDIELAAKAGARIHIAHVSCKESVEIIRKAKKKGIQVTAETAPHYFALTDECCATYDTNTKINPPLRTAEDVAAIKGALADGTIDVIASDHAPHTDCEKDVEFDLAPFGKIGLESSLGISVGELIEGKILTWPKLVEKFAMNPARILGLKSGTLKKGSPADITIIDPKKEYTLIKETLESKSKNSPFIGWRLTGKAVGLFVAGKPVMLDGKIL
ncbi:MAG: dihydroorotase [Candidatus Omnitrophica bacterium]|nr:dihydroorotase [Candidatus Omnitrophota bacterium]